MSTIINIETSTEVCSVALCKDNKVIALKENKEGLNHAKLVTIFVDAILEEAEIDIKEIDAIGISKGPGSYTGLRIGVSTAKGLCYGAQIPMIGINTLQAISVEAIKRAENIDKDTWFCPMIDARRMEVFCAFFDTNNKQQEDIKAVIVDQDSFKEILTKRKVVFFGNGAEKCKETITHKNAIFIDNIRNSAANMAALSNEAFKNQSFEDIAYFEPFYLKDFVAIPSKKKLL
ncbi:MAG: tRNA (adenosine(37)-N6)-threonylcarbamoyltransferase complex dimerization subunit type 1 TsaB [Marinifilaceae bacterium]